MSKVSGGTAPIFNEKVIGLLYSNPLPQVLILTAIVVGISTTALGLGIVVRIKEEYGTIEEHEIQEIDRR
jgi:multicomponent Na+:H+ antiporter subunit C